MTNASPMALHPDVLSATRRTSKRESRGMVAPRRVVAMHAFDRDADVFGCHTFRHAPFLRRQTVLLSAARAAVKALTTSDSQFGALTPSALSSESTARNSAQERSRRRT
jgi:hypothetical protein